MARTLIDSPGAPRSDRGRLLFPERRRELLGAWVDAVTLEEAVEAIDRRIVADEACQHMSLNAAKFVKFQRDEPLAAAVRRCELVTADGQAVLWAARALGRRLPERVTGIDLMHGLLDVSARRGYGVFLLGARAHVLHRAEQRMHELYPALRVVGRHDGYFSREDESSVVEQIAGSKPEILLVALETPAKELFILRHRDRLDVPFVMGVGGAFDILAGVRRRAPKWMQRTGLEWLFRLLQDPRRLARRYLVGNAQFVWLVLRERVRQKAVA
jgi:N-acetylglucosaminyldiphosphoundecaprenol N-acetyl-beta-D-mannosaminyltransferase